MVVNVELDRAEQAYVDAEVARLQRTNPSETAETFVARMTKKLVGKWVADQRDLQLESVRADFLSLSHVDRDEALEAFRVKIDELKETTQSDATVDVRGTRQ